MGRRSLNISSIVGAIFAFVILYHGGISMVENPIMFFDPHALLLVVGGTISASMLAFPVAHLSQVFDFILFSVFRSKKHNHLELAKEMTEIHRGLQENDPQVGFSAYSHPFLTEGVALLGAKEPISQNDLSEILEDRIYSFNRKYLQDAKVLHAIAKYPPAFGLLGATTGMIAMMANLGTAGGPESIGRAMAVALVATFWGIAASNFLLLPLADNAQKAFLSDQFTREFIREGVLLMRKNVSRKLFVERISSMLPIDQRTVCRQTLLNLGQNEFGTITNFVVNKSEEPLKKAK